MKDNLETATLAGGCFWCTEAIFKRLQGVVSVSPGYTGGTTDNPSYEEVCWGSTGHAEAIQIVFDPEKISFKKILDIFWNTHNPTSLNQQGDDFGTQYRSAIFYHDERQKVAAETSKKEFEDEGIYDRSIVTTIIPFTKFYPAEDYHKNYFDSNKNAPYCEVVISPKIHKLLEKYGQDVKKKYRL